MPKNTWQLTIYCLLAEVRRKQKDQTIKFIEFLGKLIRSPPILERLSWLLFAARISQPSNGQK